MGEKIDRQEFIDRLSCPIFSKEHNLRFEFKSNYQRDPERYINEDDKASGKFTITNTVTNKVNNGSYRLIFGGNLAHMDIRFEDFVLQYPDQFLMTNHHDRGLVKTFDEMIKFLEEEFPEIP